MKVKELIEKLEKYKDSDIEFVFSERELDEEKINTYISQNIYICDCGYNDKVFCICTSSEKLE
jgi:hypothetical protein